MKKYKFESTMHSQRMFLGIICGLLPICCVLFGLLGTGTNPTGWWNSISATYYANSKMWLIGSLTLASFFFFTYKGYDLGDRVFTTISGIASICIVIFPCNINSVTDTHVGLLMLPINVSHIIHCIAASVLFIGFALMILIQFTKGNNKKRNILYIVCGSIIAVFMLNQILSVVLNYPGYWTMINEFFMLEAFAVAWIVKGASIQKIEE